MIGWPSVSTNQRPAGFQLIYLCFQNTCTWSGPWKRLYHRICEKPVHQMNHFDMNFNSAYAHLLILCDHMIWMNKLMAAGEFGRLVSHILIFPLYRLLAHSPNFHQSNNTYRLIIYIWRVKSLEIPTLDIRGRFGHSYLFSQWSLAPSINLLQNYIARFLLFNRPHRNLYMRPRNQKCHPSITGGPRKGRSRIGLISL